MFIHSFVIEVINLGCVHEDRLYYMKPKGKVEHWDSVREMHYKYGSFRRLHTHNGGNGQMMHGFKTHKLWCWFCGGPGVVLKIPLLMAFTENGNGICNSLADSPLFLPQMRCSGIKAYLPETSLPTHFVSITMLA